MRLRYRVRWEPKHGNSIQEYEDAAWPERDLDLECAAFRCAVADGATETSFAGMWAASLTRAWCTVGERRLGRELPRLQEEWQREVGKRPLPWYAEEKVRHGAFSSLLGLDVRRDTWRAVAIGDSCLAQIREGRLRCAFPLQSAAAFTNRPALLPSRGPAPRAETISGDWQAGDSFLLMTDALMQYWLTVLEQDEMIWPDLERFEGWVQEQRAAGMRNDDVTLLRLDLE